MERRTSPVTLNSSFHSHAADALRLARAGCWFLPEKRRGGPAGRGGAARRGSNVHARAVAQKVGLLVRELPHVPAPPLPTPPLPTPPHPVLTHFHFPARLFLFNCRAAH